MQQRENSLQVLQNNVTKHESYRTKIPPSIEANA
jgi:hypothetical protein